MCSWANLRFELKRISSYSQNMFCGGSTDPVNVFATDKTRTHSCIYRSAYIPNASFPDRIKV
jgi:hypothetical protein